jgi:hypothetical protein
VSFISGFHASSEVVNDLPKFHGLQGTGGRVDLDARGDPLVTGWSRRLAPVKNTVARKGLRSAGVRLRPAEDDR